MPSVEAAILGLLALATVGLIRAHRRARSESRPISLSAAIGTGVILGLMTVEVAVVVVLLLTGAVA